MSEGGPGGAACALLAASTGLVVLVVLTRRLYRQWRQLRHGGAAIARCPTIPVSAIRTGDLLLMISRARPWSAPLDFLVSTVFQCFLGHVVHHVGVAYRHARSARLSVWEMRGAVGPSLTPWRLASQKYDLFVRPRLLAEPIDDARFRRVMREQRAYRFDWSIVATYCLGSFGLMSTSPHRRDEARTKMACSQFTFDVYTRLGLLSRQCRSRSGGPYPIDFAMPPSFSEVARGVARRFGDVYRAAPA